MKNSKKNRTRLEDERCKHEDGLPPIKGKTENQKLYLKALTDPTVSVVIADGPAGCGKSFLAACVAADSFRQNKIEHIIVARPYVQTGKTSGYKPGSSLEKLYPYVRNILDTLKKRLGRGVYENHLKDGLTGEIEVQELESIRGRSFDAASMLLIDEAQQSLPEEMESIITRLGDHCKLVIAGDIAQKDIKGKSGMDWVIDFFYRHDMIGKQVVHIEFTTEDCVRSGFVKDVLVGLERDKSEGIFLKDYR